MSHLVGGRIWQRWYTAKLDGILLFPRSHANGDGDGNSYIYSYKVHSHAAASPDTSTAPVAFIDEEETDC